MRMRRRPLVRAAMVGGGAYAAGKARQRGQERQADEEQRLAALEQQSAAAPPPSAAPAGSGDVVGKLKELKELQDSGALTAEEFEVAKQKVLQGS
jgi:hypothetical protein